jgi:hypothetical protein
MSVKRQLFLPVAGFTFSPFGSRRSSGSRSVVRLLFPMPGHPERRFQERHPGALIRRRRPRRRSPGLVADLPLSTLGRTKLAEPSDCTGGGNDRRATVAFHMRHSVRVPSPDPLSSIQVGTIYEDCAFHPVLCTYRSDEEDELQGISLIDGRVRACSVFHCGAEPRTIDQVLVIRRDFDAYRSLPRGATVLSVRGGGCVGSTRSSGGRG